MSVVDKKKEPRYWWLKLKKPFFNQLSQKKMRKQQNGMEMQIAYLEMMLLSVDKGGNIYYQGIYDSLEEEIAEELNEPLELIQKTIEFITNNKMAEIDSKEGDIFIPEVQEITGSESGSAPRVREHRERKKAKETEPLHCNKEPLHCNKETELLHCNTETETDKDTEIDKDIDTETELSDSGSVSDKYTMKDIIDCVKAGKVKITDREMQAFYDQIKNDGWTMYGKPIDNLLRAVREYAKKHRGNGQGMPVKKPDQARKNAFHNFNQREYDFEKIERELVAKHKNESISKVVLFDVDAIEEKILGKKDKAPYDWETLLRSAYNMHPERVDMEMDLAVIKVARDNSVISEKRLIEMIQTKDRFGKDTWRHTLALNAGRYLTPEQKAYLYDYEYGKS